MCFYGELNNLYVCIYLCMYVWATLRLEFDDVFLW
jgi:hypothetical protein